MIGFNVPMLNENALSNMLTDIDFLGEELKHINRPHLVATFAELRSVIKTFSNSLKGSLTFHYIY